LGISKTGSSNELTSAVKALRDSEAVNSKVSLDLEISNERLEVSKKEAEELRSRLEDAHAQIRTGEDSSQLLKKAILDVEAVNGSLLKAKNPNPLTPTVTVTLTLTLKP